MSTINEKLSKLASDTPSTWKEKARYRRENRAWLRKSATIAVKVMVALRAQGMSQKDLAEKMGISPQQINKIAKGHENLTLETITKLEDALGICIIPEGENDARSAAELPVKPLVLQ